VAAVRHKHLVLIPASLDRLEAWARELADRNGGGPTLAREGMVLELG
jgi:hypothetical protein